MQSWKTAPRCHWLWSLWTVIGARLNWQSTNNITTSLTDHINEQSVHLLTLHKSLDSEDNDFHSGCPVDNHPDNRTSRINKLVHTFYTERLGIMAKLLQWREIIFSDNVLVAVIFVHA